MLLSPCGDRTRDLSLAARELLIGNERLTTWPKDLHLRRVFTWYITRGCTSPSPLASIQRT